MGYGDEIMATGMARGLAAQGKRAAFGDGERIKWGPWSDEIFRYNPNIAPQTADPASVDLVWIAHYKGLRAYNKMGPEGRWIWNMNFRATPGEFFFDRDEIEFANAAAAAIGGPFVVIEPNLPWHKRVAGNKDWGAQNFQIVTDTLRSHGVRMVQFRSGLGRREDRSLHGAKHIGTPTFRKAVALLSRASLYIGPEGGLHHAAAAVKRPAVVLFGGFIPPEVTGYDTHVNLTGDSDKACGSTAPCQHCRAAMASIKPREVIDAAQTMLAMLNGKVAGGEDDPRAATVAAQAPVAQA